MTETFYHVPTTEILGIEMQGPNRFKIHIAHAEFAFSTNFAGNITQYDRNGHPTGTVCFNYEDAMRLHEEYGFKLYEYNPRKNNPDLDPQQYPNKLCITFKLSMDSPLVRDGVIPMPNVISVIQGREDETRVQYDATTVGILDTAEKVDTTIVVNCTRANADKGQKWTQPYIESMGFILAPRITYFEEQFGLFN